ncbi:MAG: rhodanese-like domain-containing protein [Methanomassiliicoccus sp.]|nr:rhodanese-like domain-containing protein [Methanomassiliicoccus sp.]
MKRIKTVPAEDLVALKEDISEGRCAFLDVRERSEFEAGHIPLAVLRPLSELESWSRELEKDRPVLLCCKTGKRSQRCAEVLISKGFSDVSFLEGGYAAWYSRTGR